MTGKHGQRGEGRIGLVLALAVIGLGIFVALKIIPVRIAGYEFLDAMRDEARFASVRDNAVVTRRLLNKAAHLDIPLTQKDLRIDRSSSEIVIEARYEQKVDLAITTYVYKFNATERAPLF